MLFSSLFLLLVFVLIILFISLFSFAYFANYWILSVWIFHFTLYWFDYWFSFLYDRLNGWTVMCVPNRYSFLDVIFVFYSWTCFLLPFIVCVFLEFVDQRTHCFAIYVICRIFIILCCLLLLSAHEHPNSVSKHDDLVFRKTHLENNGILWILLYSVIFLFDRHQPCMSFSVIS